MNHLVEYDTSHGRSEPKKLKRTNAPTAQKGPLPVIVMGLETSGLSCQDHSIVLATCLLTSQSLQLVYVLFFIFDYVFQRLVEPGGFNYVNHFQDITIQADSLLFGLYVDV